MNLRDIYGTCRRQPCDCLRQAWLGRACMSWVPVGPKDQAGLAQWHRDASTKGRAPYTTAAPQQEKQDADC